MKGRTRNGWKSFGWFCLGILPMLGYLVLGFAVSAVLSILWMVPAILQGNMGLIEDLGQFTMVTGMVYAVLGLIGFGLWYYFGCRRRELLPPKGVLAPKNMLLLFLSAIGAQYVIGYVVAGIEVVLPEAVESYEELVETAGLGELTFLMVVYVVILGPIAEELIFRGLTFYYMKKATSRFWLANLLQAALFGIMHMNLVQGIYAFLLGMVLGWVYQRFQSLYASIFLHICINGLGSVIDLLFGDSSSWVMMILWNVLGIAATVIGLRFLFRRQEKVLR